MNAGKELDALVAEKVMGWKRMTYAQKYQNVERIHGYKNDARLTLFWHSDHLDRFNEYKEEAPAEDMYEEDAWSPSTNIADSLQVIEKIKSLPYSTNGDGEISELRLTWCNQKKLWTVRIWNEDFEEFSSESLPLAICLAALRAVGVDS